jgi:hypothetical protein
LGRKKSVIANCIDDTIDIEMEIVLTGHFVFPEKLGVYWPCEEIHGKERRAACMIRTPPNKFPILYTLKRSNSKSFISAFEHGLLFMSIFFLKIPISAIQKSKEIWGLTSIIFCDWTLRLDI